MTEDMACKLEKVPEGYEMLDIGFGGAKKDKGFMLLSVMIFLPYFSCTSTHLFPFNMHGLHVVSC